jgi:hypothetical protein
MIEMSVSVPSSSGSDVRNDNFKDSMNESGEYFISYDDQHVFGTSSSASFSIPGTRVCLDAFFRSPRIERRNNSAIALSGHRDSLKKERNPTLLRQILEIEIDSAVMTGLSHRGALRFTSPDLISLPTSYALLQSIFIGRWIGSCQCS